MSGIKKKAVKKPEITANEHLETAITSLKAALTAMSLDSDDIVTLDMRYDPVEFLVTRGPCEPVAYGYVQNGDIILKFVP